MRKIKKFLLVSSLLFLPVLSFAQNPNPLVTCDGSASKPCDFLQFMGLINRVINFILVDLVIPIAAILFAYAGFIMITAGGEAAHARTKAKGIFMNAFFGLIIAVACWLIVKTILSILGYNQGMFGF